MISQKSKVYAFGPFVLDTEQRVLFRKGKPLRLTPKSFDTLRTLVEHRGTTVEKEDLMRQVWPDTFVEEANLAVNISSLRKLLGEMPDGRHYIETLPKRGYRLAASVTVLEPDLVGGLLSQSVHVDRPSAAADQSGVFAQIRQHKKLVGAGLGILIVSSAIITYVALFSTVENRYPSEPRRLAVLPFTNDRADEDIDFLSFSLADAIITKLGYVNSLIVRPSSYVEKYHNQVIDSRRIAEELKVDSLLTGRYVRDGDDLIVTVQLEDVGSGTTLWGETINIEYKNLLTVQDYVTQQVIRRLKLNLTSAEKERLKRDTPQHAEAYEYFLRAIPLISTSNHRKAIELLTKSVEIDPGYALAWAFLGRAYSISALQYYGGRKDYVEAQADYEQALVLNPEQFQTRLFMANLYIETNRVEEAIPLLRAVADSNPNIAYAHWEMSYAYRYAGMLNESVEQGERALRLDPNLTSHVFNSYFYVGQYARFMASLPAREDAYVIFYRGLGHYYLEDRKMAAAHFDRAYELDPMVVYAQIGKALSLSISGQNTEGRSVLKAAEAKLNNGGVADGEITYKFAQAYAAVGDKQAALRALGRSVEQGFFCYPYFLADPLLETIRGEPEYSSIIDTVQARHEQFKRRFF